MTERSFERENPDQTDGKRRSLELLFANYVERLNEGETIDPQEIIEQHPEFAADLLRELDTYESLQTAGVASATRDSLGTLGDYTLRRQIGRGGMGVVYEAWEHSMDRRVALKVLPGAVAADEKALLRFVREAKIAGDLQHPNVVPVYGMGLKEKTPYYAMQYVEGETLAQILGKLGGTEAEAETVFGKKDCTSYFENLAKAFADVADGLQHAHSKGVCHRDIKPSNLILDSEGRFRILDFGLARIEGQESLTTSGDFVGTPLYMSPEQARRKRIPVDHRTDVYSLGATMYEAISGRPPFRGRDHVETLSQIIDREPKPPRQFSPRIPANLETIVLKCLRKDPSDRYGTAEALAQDLRRFVRRDPIEARPEARIAGHLRRLWKVRWRLASTSCALLLVVLLGIVLIGHRHKTRRLQLLSYEQAMIGAALATEQASLVHNRYTGRLDLVDPMLSLDVKYFGLRGDAQSEQNTFTGLKESLRRWTTTVSDRPEAPYYLAKTLLLLGEPDEALVQLREALARYKSFEPARFFRDQVLVDPEPATPDWADQQGRGSNGRWPMLWLEAQRAIEKRDWLQAARTLDALDRLYRADGEPYFGASVESCLGRAKARLEAGDLYGAVEALAVARERWPAAMEPRLLLAKAYYLLGQEEKLDATLEALHRSCAEDSQSAPWITFFCYSLYDFDRARVWARKIANDKLRLAVEADILNHLGLLDEAESAAAESLQLDGRFFYAKLMLGVVHSRRENSEDAARLYREIIEESKREYVPALVLLGSSLCSRGKYEEGLSLLEEAKRRDPEYLHAYIVLADVHLMRQEAPEAEAGLLAEAERELLALLQINPRFARAHQFLGYTYMRMKKYGRAFEEIAEAIRLSPRYSLHHYSMGRLYDERGESAQAITSYREAIRLAPHRPEAYRRLASLLDRGVKLDCRHELWALAELLRKNRQTDGGSSLPPEARDVLRLVEEKLDTLLRREKSVGGGT